MSSTCKQSTTPTYFLGYRTRLKRLLQTEFILNIKKKIKESGSFFQPPCTKRFEICNIVFSDIEMRVGFLGRMNDALPINGHMLQQPSGLGDMHRALPAGAEPPASQQNQFSWHPSGDIHMAVAGQGTVPMDTRNHNKDTEDVEVMSTDSSSSSSSDSQ